jgi:hypothetical protein
MLGELLGSQYVPWVSGQSIYKLEGLVLAVFRVSRISGTSRSLTIFLETLDGGGTVIQSELFAVRSAGEWDGELHAIADLFTQNFSAGTTSIFNWVAEARQINCGNVRTGGATLPDNYPVDAGNSSLFYHLRGIRAQCRRSAVVAAMDAQGVHTIRQPKLAIFRNPTTHTKRWFVRSRIFYQENWVVPLESLQLAPSGNNTVGSADAIGNFPLGTVYTGDEHPEIDLNGTRRAAAIDHRERSTIEPFYYLSDLTDGKSIRVTIRELADNMTADPVMNNTYPTDGSARSDQSSVTISQFAIEGRFIRLGAPMTVTETGPA